MSSTKQGKQDSEDKQLNAELFEWGYSRLADIYKEKAPDKLKLLEAAFHSKLSSQ